MEHGSFVPLVFSATGGMGPSTTVAYKRLASLLSQKRDHPHAETMRWLRCRLCFGLLKAAIVAIRGSRSSARSNYTPDSIALAVAEGMYHTNSYIKGHKLCRYLLFYCSIISLCVLKNNMMRWNRYTITTYVVLFLTPGAFSSNVWLYYKRKQYLPD